MESQHRVPPTANSKGILHNKLEQSRGSIKSPPLLGYPQPLISIPKTSLIGGKQHQNTYETKPTIKYLILKILLQFFMGNAKFPGTSKHHILQGVILWNMNEKTLFRQFARVHFVFVPFSYQDLYVTSIIQMPHAKYQMWPSDFCHEIQNKYKHEGRTLDSGNNVVTKSYEQIHGW